MPRGLVRYQKQGHHHFITFSCYHRLPYLDNAGARDIFVRSLERIREDYDFNVLGYVVMPEHVHLLVSEPANEPLSKALQALKISVSRQMIEKPFWQRRYHDFNVITRDKAIEKLSYIHQNPVKRGLVNDSSQWSWSSAHLDAGGVTLTPLGGR